ncbi:MFS transporter [Streptomyces flavidovirens]|uniref:MFS transporter n=1 Tax=Streptomyces flavidovirens TaxID=67298 RepID=UPI00341A37A6
MSVYRLLSGVGEGVQATALYAVIGAFFFYRRAVAAGVVGVAFGAGVFLGPLVGTGLAESWASWRAPFFMFAAAGLLMCLAIAGTVSRKLTEAVAGGEGPVAASYDHVPPSPYNRNTLGLGVATAVSTCLMYQVATSAPAQYVLSFLVGAFASGFLFTNCATAMQRSVRPEHIGRGAGLFILTYYVAAAFSGLLFARLVGEVGWRGAGFWQLTVLPLIGIAGLALTKTSRMILPRTSAQ